MNTRILTPDESEKVETLKKLSIKHELLFITETGIQKNILDATQPIVELLKTEQVHNYDLQNQGPKYKVMFPCIILSNNQKEETKTSLYRPETKSGDPRFWPKL